MRKLTEHEVKKWVRNSNHNEPMFYQVASVAAEWGYRQRCLEELSNLGQEIQAPETP